MSHPSEKIKMNGVDLVLELLAAGIVIAMFLFVGFHLSSIPGEYPTHFDAEGTPIAFGSRAKLWMLPALSALIYLGFTLLSRIPHRFNYPVKVTDTNRRALYTMALRALRVLKLLICLLYGYTLYNQVMSITQGNTLDKQILYVLAIAIVLIPMLLIVRMLTRYRS